MCIDVGAHTPPAAAIRPSTTLPTPASSPVSCFFSLYAPPHTMSPRGYVRLLLYSSNNETRNSNRAGPPYATIEKQLTDTGCLGRVGGGTKRVWSARGGGRRGMLVTHHRRVPVWWWSVDRCMFTLFIRNHNAAPHNNTLKKKLKIIKFFSG